MRWVWLILLVASLAAAEDRPGLEPLASNPAHPVDNPGTIEKIKLGEMLFFENLLSGGNRRSCGTCHKPELLFMDGLSRAWGLHDMELRRKTPGLLNVGWQRSLFSDGRAKTLEEQASKPLENHLEMDLEPEEAAEKIRRDPVYPQLFEKVFPGEPITFGLIAKAIAAFERTLVSYDSDFDRYLLGDETALKPEAVRGMDLFKGKAGCIRCHHGPLLTDHEFHYTGVPEISGGTPQGTKHKTQSLRDANRRSSYMHNGHYLKLRHVIEHYARGGSAPDGLETEIEPFDLSEEDKSDLMAFLRSLNGRITNFAEDSPADTDIFNAPPSKKAAGPAQDPSYLNRKRR
jgi:cytochrome c peroxidase